jgi:hypothetical protein
VAAARPRSAAIYPAVFLTSASILMLQVALTRIFSFTLWYHFAYVVISLALLGYGASGALLSAFPGVLTRNLPRTLCLCAVVAAIVIPAGLAVYAATPFYPFQLVTAPVQWAYLAAYYAAAGIPFFLAGVCIAGAITAASDRVTRVYCADLIGAGLGAGIVVPLIWRLETPGVVVVSAGLMAGAAVCWAWWWRPRVALAPVVVIAILAAGGGPFWRSLSFQPSIEKQMAELETRSPVGSGAREGEPQRSPTTAGDARGGWRLVPRYTRWGAVFRVDVLESLDPNIGQLPSPGLSARFRGIGPSWLYVPHDGDAAALIYDGRNPQALPWFDGHAIGLPWVFLGRGAKVLVLGAGGGKDVLAAIRHHAKSITAVELDPLTTRLVTRDFADYAGGLEGRPNVHYVVGEGRSFVRRSGQTYDLIHNNSTDTLTAMSIGAYVLNENYLYTVEAFEEYFKHLNKDGLIYLAHLGTFPRSRMFGSTQGVLRTAALRDALLRLGAARPENNIAVIWANGLMTYLARLRPFSPQDVAALDRYCVDNGFRPVHLPYHSYDNQLSWFMRSSPRDRAEYARRSPLETDAPTDDAPFVWPRLKWRYMLQWPPTLGRLSVWTGQVVMIPLLCVGVLGSLLFILGPLAAFRRRGVYSRAAPGLAVYFAALGFGFMFIEISFIQKFVLFLGYPTLSLTVVLSALLVSSGVGSLASQRLIARPGASLRWALGALIAIGALYILFGGSVFEFFLGYALWARIVVAVALIAPLGFVMGMFFPTGIRVVNQVAPQFVPWAWGINASTSVVAAILAVMLAMSIGFRMVAVLSFLAYIIGVIGISVARRRVFAAPRAAVASRATPAAAGGGS